VIRTMQKEPEAKRLQADAMLDNSALEEMASKK
jgi:hypothetical protein